MFDIASAVLLAKTAINAYTELKEQLAEGKEKLSAENEAELKPYLMRLRQQNEELFRTVDDKLSAAALVDTDGEGLGPAPAVNTAPDGIVDSGQGIPDTDRRT